MGPALWRSTTRITGQLARRGVAAPRVACVARVPLVPLVPLVMALLAACSGVPTSPSPYGAPGGAPRVRGAGVGAFEDPTVRGGRLVPERVDPALLTGSEPDGARRGILSGYRVLVSPDGAIRVSDERLPNAPNSDLAVPSRLGGGYLHVVGAAVLRSETWLSEVIPIHRTRSPVQKLLVGLDRVYVRTQQGHTAIDPRSGEAKDLGPFPPGPLLAAYAARDGWRAAALADLVGLVATDDAGATWRPLDVGFQPRNVSVSPDGLLVVSGVEASRSVSAEIREGGQVVRLGAVADRGKRMAESTRDKDDELPSKPPEVRAFGPRPLLAAVEDGWPLTDGVALVARDGALARVRLEDGALLEAVPGAFSLSPARCRGVSLTRPEARGAFGFVCGEPRGRTDLYAYDPAAGRLVLLRRFEKPRVVLSSANGALAIRGSCSPEGAPEPDKQRTYCVLDHGNRFREVRVRGDVGSERVAVLSNRGLAILSPPTAPSGELGTARLTLLDAKGAAKTVPLGFPRLTADVARALRYGVWLDGVEERRPGVVGAWVDAGGSVLGLEIELDGTVKVGQYVRDAGYPTVSGKYGFGYTNARRLFETSDGGMTWRSEEAPEPLVPLVNVTSRAVGPIGATGGGWLRVGWGPREKKAASAEPRALEPAGFVAPVAPPLVLDCEPLAPTPKVPAAEREPAPKVPKPVAPSLPPVGSRVPGGRVYPPMVTLAPYGMNRYPSELGPFYATAPPKLREGEHPILNVDAYESLDRAPRSGALAKVYAWGPKTPDPDPASRFTVRWLGPFDGYPEVRTTAPSALPAALVEGMRAGVAPTYPYYPGAYSSSWKLAIGDDGGHALLAARVAGRQGLTLWELEADRGPMPVRRADGETFAEVEAAVRVEGRWVVAVPHSATLVDPNAGTQLFVLDGGTARPLARIPRATPTDTGQVTGRLARRADGRAVGYVVDASGSGSRGQAERWVVSVDLETGAVGTPMSLGAPDYSDGALGVCLGDEPGYVLDVPFAPNALRLRVGPSSGAAPALSNVLARMRLSPGRACLEAASGTAVGDGSFVARKAAGTRAAGASTTGSPAVRVTALWSQMRYPLACSASVTGP